MGNFGGKLSMLKRAVSFSPCVAIAACNAPVSGHAAILIFAHAAYS